MPLVDVSEIRRDTGIEDTNLITDTQIQEFIEQEEAKLRSEIGTLFESGDVEEYLDGDDTNSIVLRYSPINNIYALRINDTEISPDSYIFYPEEAKVVLKSGSFTAGNRNIYVFYNFDNSYKQKIAKQIVHDLTCIDVFLFVGAKVSEGVESEKLDNYTLKFDGKPYNQTIEELKERVKINLAKIGINFIIV